MFNKFQEQFTNLSQREKFFVIIVILAVIGSSWNYYFYQSIVQRQNTLKQQLDIFKAQQPSQQQIVAALETRNSINDARVDNEHKLIDLKAQYARQQELILFGKKNFIPASLMAKVLGDILDKNQQMKLIKLETLATITLLAVKQPNQPIYQHGLVVTFTGNYLDTVNYLKALEALPWAISWEGIDYQVKEYPLAEVTIHLVTLSFDKDWLGV
jgi:MSHA biogenesis protein MshJ